jgi:hypothetical protein
MSSSAGVRTARIARVGRLAAALPLLGVFVAISAAFAPAAQARQPVVLTPAASLTSTLVGGQISGTVTTAASKAALAGVEVCAYSGLSEFGGELGEHCATSNAAGEYSVSGLPAADYTVEFYSLGGEYATQYYDGKASFLEATKVPLAEGATVSGIDAEMFVAGKITGTVTTGGAPLEDIKVCAVEIGDEFIAQCASSGPDGEYTISRLPAAEYTVDFYSLSGSYVTQYYDEKSLLAGATKVPVTAGGVTAGIDAAMVVAGEIKGTVEEAGSEKRLENIKVCAYESGEAIEQCTSTSSSGEYTISRLAAAAYTVGFSALSGQYVTQYYPGKALSSEATKVQVTGGEVTTGVDASMTTSGQITGTVTDLEGGAALEDIRVCAHESGGEAIVLCTLTGASGEYAITRLPAGEYVVTFEAQHGEYLTQYYSGDESAAAKVPVANGVTDTGIDAVMQPLKDAVAPVNEAPPNIMGTAEVGAILTCAKGSWTGNPVPGFGYQWLRDGTPIAGAISRFYTVQINDQAHALTCAVTASNFKGTVTTLSAPLGVPAESPANVEAPRIYGTPSVGSILACEAGAWTGYPKPEFSYQWLRSAEVSEGATSRYKIEGATSSTYIVQATDRGQSLICDVTGTNPAGAASAYSEPAPVAPEIKSNTASTPSSNPAGSASIDVQGFIAAKNAAVSLSGSITSKAGVVLVPLRCWLTSGNCPVTTIQVTVVEDLRGGSVTGIAAAAGANTAKRKVVVAKLSVTLRAGQSKTVKVALNVAGRKLLAAHRRFAAQVTVVVERTSIGAHDVTIVEPARKKL